MITKDEILKGVKESDLNELQLKYLYILLQRIGDFRAIYDKPMKITSGFRTGADQTRVYQELAAKRGQIFDASKVPWGSAHLKCAAVDVFDPDGSLMEYCLKNKTQLEIIGLWCEEKDDQQRVHFQIYAPESGNRFFKP